MWLNHFYAEEILFKIWSEKVSQNYFATIYYELWITYTKKFHRCDGLAQNCTSQNKMKYHTKQL
jgi:hypothetical protein